jgi:L-alanine-DL-glutamate epimerase-like enolase superfamily enzyme
MIANRRAFQDGVYAVPEGPGFGLEFDWDYINRYRSEAVA